MLSMVVHNEQLIITVEEVGGEGMCSAKIWLKEFFKGFNFLQLFCCK